MHLYRRALKGSLDRIGNILVWRPEALAIRAQFEAHKVQNTHQARAKHLHYLEMLSANNDYHNPFISASSDPTGWTAFVAEDTYRSDCSGRFSVAALFPRARTSRL